MRGWIESNLDRLYGFAFAMAQDVEQARDLVQECAVRALEARRSPNDEAAYRAWLFRILRNAFIDRCRKQGRETGIEEALDVAEDEETRWSGDRRIVDVITVRIAIAKLPIAHREIIALVDLTGFSYSEAAKILDIAEGTVMSRLARARGKLLSIMQEDNITPLVRRAQGRGTRR